MKTSFTGKFGETTFEEAIFVLVLGLCLSLNSGYINGLCISGMLSQEGSRTQGVAAFTGTYTKSGLALASSDSSLFGFNIFLILCFVGGACISGVLNPEAVPHKLAPSYGPTFLIGSGFMILSATFAELNANGKALFYCAAVANGLQNGMTSMYSANLIRTSHLTGTSTDIGLIAGQMLRGNFKNSWKFKILVALASSFWYGGLLAYWAASAFLSRALWFSAGLYMLIGLSHVIFVMLAQNVSFFQSMFGRWEWDKVLNQLSVVNHGFNFESADDEEIQRMTRDIDAVFNSIDKDDSNTIDSDELSEALSKLDMKVTKQALDVMIKVVDENGNGEIDREEFHVLVRLANIRAKDKRDKTRKRSQKRLLKQGQFKCFTTISDGTAADINAVFDSIDTDGSGTIDADELFESLTKLNMKVSKQAMQNMIEVVDENGDGVIDREEFHALVQLANVRARNKAEKVQKSELSASPLPLLEKTEMEEPYNNAINRDSAAPTVGIGWKNITSESCVEEKNNVERGSGDEVRFLPSTVDPALPRTLSEALPHSSAKTQQQLKPNLVVEEQDRRMYELEQNDPRAIIVTQNKHPYNIVGVNNTWEKLCGYQSSEVIGQTMPHLIQGPETNCKGLQEAMTNLVQGEDVQCTTVNYRKDGSTFCNQLSMGALYNNESGDVDYFVGILRNLGDLAKAVGGVSGNEEKNEDTCEYGDSMMRRIGNLALNRSNGSDISSNAEEKDKLHQYGSGENDEGIAYQDIEQGSSR